MTSSLVVGASGFLGQHLLQLLGKGSVGTYSTKSFPGGIAFDATLTRLADVEASLPTDLKYVYILYGAVNPDWCARDPEATSKINVESIVTLLEDCFARQLMPIFMSTDYVYDSAAHPRLEDEPRSATTQYGLQKGRVEAWLEGIDKPWLICRSSKIVSGDVGIHSVLGQWVNDIKAGKTMRCADDQIFTPGSVDDMATALVELATSGARGIYHVAGPRSMSRYDLAALLIGEVRKLQPEQVIHFETCKLSEIPFAEKRPLDTSLSTAKLAATITHRFTAMEDLARDVARQHFQKS
jgi:dTDP-4-dehydrorhamnose reductase